MTQHMLRVIQLSAIYTEMLMVLREPDTLARSFDGEDSRVADLRVAVSDCRGDSGQAQVDIRQEFRSSPMEPRRNMDIINDAMKKGQKLYRDLCFVKRTSDEGELLEVTQSFALQISQANYVSVARVVLSIKQGIDSYL